MRPLTAFREDGFLNLANPLHVGTNASLRSHAVRHAHVQPCIHPFTISMEPIADVVIYGTGELGLCKDILIYSVGT